MVSSRLTIFDVILPLPWQPTDSDSRSLRIPDGRLRRGIVAAAGVLAVALIPGAVSAQSPVPQLSDSAGVTMVTYGSLPALLPTLAVVSPTPRVIIGADQRVLLDVVTSAVRLAPGTIAIANTRAAAVLFVDLQGRLITTFGRPGQGPGEFTSLSWIRKFGPSEVIAFDRGGRVTVIDARGRLVTQVRMNGLPLGLLTDGRLLASQRMQRALERAGGRARDSSVFTMLNTQDEWRVVDTVGMFPNSDLRITVSSRGTGPMVMVGYSQPLARTVSVQPVGGGFVFGDADSFQLKLFSGQGVLSRVIRLATPTVKATPAHLKEWVDAHLTTLAERGRAAAGAVLAAVELPSTVPAFGRIVTDGVNRIWVQAYSLDERTDQKWIVFNVDGTIAGQVVIPGGLLVLDVGADYVLGLRRGVDDTEHVVMYDLAPAR